MANHKILFNLFFLSLLHIILCSNLQSAEKFISMKSDKSEGSFVVPDQQIGLYFCMLPSYLFAVNDTMIAITDCNNNRVLIYNLKGEFIKKLYLPTDDDGRVPNEILGSDNSGNLITFHNCLPKNYSNVGKWNIEQGTYKYINLNWDKANKKFSDFTFPSYMDGYIRFGELNVHDRIIIFDMNGDYICDTEYTAWSHKGIGLKWRSKFKDGINYGTCVFCFTKEQNIEGEIIKEVEFYPHGVLAGYNPFFLGFDDSGKAYYFRTDLDENNLLLSIIMFDPYSGKHVLKKETIPGVNGYASLEPEFAILPNGVIIVRVIQLTQQDAIVSGSVSWGDALVKPDAIQVDFWKIKF